mmetsp:Transcript_9544/g.11530  ORF Transcript_9544/g.11530 Transcript_9544/m.11530 type:complete len:121 (+) Transcript_9544:88-450(+)
MMSTSSTSSSSTSFDKRQRHASSQKILKKKMKIITKSDRNDQEEGRTPQEGRSSKKQSIHQNNGYDNEGMTQQFNLAQMEDFSMPSTHSTIPSNVFSAQVGDEKMVKSTSMSKFYYHHNT